MDSKNSSNDAQEITLDQLDEVNGGAAALTDRRATIQRLTLGHADTNLASSFAKLKDTGLIFRPARPRLMDAIPADLITLVERL